VVVVVTIRWEEAPDRDGILFGLTADGQVDVALKQCLPGVWLIDVADRDGSVISIGMAHGDIDEAKADAAYLVDVATR
jgi:hypothetical protein